MADPPGGAGSPCDPNDCDLVFPGWSCQYSGEKVTRVVPARVAGAEKGDLFLCPGSNAGVIGSLLAALTPPQHFTHMGIFVSEDEIRHCTFVQSRLSDKAYMTGTLSLSFGLVVINGVNTPVVPPLVLDFKPAPTNGFATAAVRFGWPGTITQKVDDAIYGDLFGDEWPTCSFLDVEHPTPGTTFPVHELSFFPVEIPDPGGGFRMLPALLVKPCTADGTGWFLRQTAWQVADAAQDISGHYRFFGYSDASIAIKGTFDGPLRAMPVAGETDPAKLPLKFTNALVCSSFVWLAVQRAARDNRVEIVLDPVQHPVDNLCIPHLLPLQGEQEVVDAQCLDGLFLYDKGQRRLAAKTLATFLSQRVHDQIVDGVSKKSDGSHTFGVDIREGIGDVIMVQNPFADSVANQMVNAFASDGVTDLQPTWASTAEGRAVSPDDIFRRLYS